MQYGLNIMDSAYNRIRELQPNHRTLVVVDSAHNSIFDDRESLIFVYSSNVTFSYPNPSQTTLTYSTCEIGPVDTTTPEYLTLVLRTGETRISIHDAPDLHKITPWPLTALSDWIFDTWDKKGILVLVLDESDITAT